MARWRPTPGEIFTPRSAEVNEEMYIDRPELQERLQRAINGSQHIIVFGDSGSGKTWLYQRYLKLHRIPFKVVDLSVAPSRGLDSAFRDALTHGYGWQPAAKTSGGSAGVSSAVTLQGSREQQYSFHDQPPFDKMIDELANSGRGAKFVVFDNLEHVSSEVDIIRDIARLIIRLDNPRFGLSGVRFLLVGVIVDMKHLVTKYDQAGTVANRLIEVPEVAQLKDDEAEALLKKGFRRLRISFDDERSFFQEAKFYTNGNAQQIHALGYQVACEAEKNNWRVGNEQVDSAFHFWAEESLAQQMSLVEARLNRVTTGVRRRNQVIYCIGAATKREFTANEIDEAVRREFPSSVSVERLGVDQILKGLADGENPLLQKSPTSNAFRLAHPKIRLAIRALLKKTQGGEVHVEALGT